MQWALKISDDRVLGAFSCSPQSFRSHGSLPRYLQRVLGVTVRSLVVLKISENFMIVTVRSLMILMIPEEFWTSQCTLS